MEKIRHIIHESYLRSMMFGLQDGIVSTTGVVVGISTGVESKAIVVLAAFVAVTVEATSMAAGQYSSEKAVHQMDKANKRQDSLMIGATIMFVSYLIGGMFSIVPTILFPQSQARVIAIISAFIGLFVVGYFKGALVEHARMRSALELLIIGGVATIIGVLVGIILKV